MLELNGGGTDCERGVDEPVPEEVKLGASGLAEVENDALDPKEVVVVVAVTTGSVSTETSEFMLVLEIVLPGVTSANFEDIDEDTEVVFG